MRPLQPVRLGQQFGGCHCSPVFGRSSASRRLLPQLARSHLVYGEWLRREARLGEARARLRTAEEMFAEIGMEAFAERARGELVAAGAKPRKRSLEAHAELTPTPLRRLRGLARSLGLANIRAKDETARFGLNAFKAACARDWPLEAPTQLGQEQPEPGTPARTAERKVSPRPRLGASRMRILHAGKKGKAQRGRTWIGSCC